MFGKENVHIVHLVLYLNMEDALKNVVLTKFISIEFVNA